MRRFIHPAALFPVAILLATLSPVALAGLEPAALYNTLNRPIMIDVEAPAGAGGDLEIALLSPRGSRELERQPVEAGRVDLAGLFPNLWGDPKAPTTYAQLYAGGEPVGPALVLQPMRTPQRAEDETLNEAIVEAAINHNIEGLRRLLDRESKTRRKIGRSAEIDFPALDDWTFSGYRVYADRNVVFDTSAGEIEIILRPDQAPNTVYNFLHLVDGGFYNDIRVDRIVPGPPPFVIQLGDPTGTRTGGPGYHIDLEPSALDHSFGVVSMARNAVHPDTGGSQIFFCLSREGTSLLDGKYTSFAQTVRGADVLLEIEQTELKRGEGSDEPLEPIVVRTVRSIPAPPYPQKPEPADRPELDPALR